MGDTCILWKRYSPPACQGCSHGGKVVPRGRQADRCDLRGPGNGHVQLHDGQVVMWLRKFIVRVALDVNNLRHIGTIKHIVV